VTTSEGGSERRPQTRLHGGVRVLGVLLGLGLLAGWATTLPATPAPTYQRARSILAGVADTPGLVDTVHADPGVLRAIGAFLPEADAANVAPVDIGAEFARIVPFPPWQWMPKVEFHKVGPGLYLVAVGHAASTQPSSLYLFDGSAHVKIDTGENGTVVVTRIEAQSDRIAIDYFPTPGSTGPQLTSVVIERQSGTWRVDHDTPDRRAVALLAQVPHSDIEDRGVHRNPILLEAFGIFFASAGPLADSDRDHRVSSMFPLNWHNARPTFRSQRVGPKLYVLQIEPRAGMTSAGSLYLFDGAHYVTLASDETATLFFEQVAVSERRVEVTYQRMPLGHVPEWATAVAEKVGRTWRIVGSK
jgi:hypothetical protein